MTQTAKVEKKKLSREERKKLLKALNYEKVNGKPIYYRNYEKVLKGEIPLEAVMGSSDIQAYLVALLVALLHSKLDPNKYLILTNEVGFFTSENSFRLLDIAVFEKTINVILKHQPLMWKNFDKTARGGSFECSF